MMNTSEVASIIMNTGGCCKFNRQSGAISDLVLKFTP